MTRRSKVVPVFLLLVFGAAASGAAMAQHRGHGFGHGGGVRFGISLGVPFYGPGYYPAPYYAYPAYGYAAPVYGYPAPAYGYAAPVYAYPGAAVAPPAAYVEQGYSQAAPSPAPAQPQGDWYYCADSKSYYPYVRECPGGWQRVPAQPPPR